MAQFRTGIRNVFDRPVVGSGDGALHLVFRSLAVSTLFPSRFEQKADRPCLPLRHGGIECLFGQIETPFPQVGYKYCQLGRSGHPMIDRGAADFEFRGAAVVVPATGGEQCG